MGISDHCNTLMQGNWNSGVVDRWPGIPVIIGCVLMEFCIFGIFDAFPGYQQYIANDKTAGSPTLEHISVSDSIINSVNPCIGVLAGFLLPYIGGRACCFFSVFCTLLYIWLTSTFVTNVIKLYLCFSIAGAFSIAFMLPIVLSIASSWFDKYRTFALGMCNVGGGLGMTVIPAITGKLMMNHTWRETMRYTSIFCIIGVIGAFLVRTRPGYDMKEKHVENEESLNEPSHEEAHQDNVGYRMFSIKEIFTVMIPTRTYISFFFTYFLYCMGFFTTLYMVVMFPLQMSNKGTIYENSKAIDIGKAASLFSWYGAGHTIGAVIFGVIGVRIDAKLLSSLLFLSAGITSMLWSLCRAYHAFAAVMLILGALNSAAGVIFVTVIGERYRGPNISVLLSLVFLAAIGGMAGAPIATKLFVDFNHYTYSCIFLGSCQVIGAIFQFFAIPKLSSYAYYRKQIEETRENFNKDGVLADNEQDAIHSIYPDSENTVRP